MAASDFLDQALPVNPQERTALLVGVDFGRPFFQEDLEEGKALLEAHGLILLDTVTAKRPRPDPATFVGKGKVADIAAAAQALRASWVVFNYDLAAIHLRNLGRHIGCTVIDRTDLILRIFAERAQTREGRLQVELAQWQHWMTRLVRGWTHLERQRGGIGLRGGPGETQLEIDRRLVEDKIRKLKQQLELVVKQREVQRNRRVSKGVRRVSLVGYTNAGKSSLFNALTRADTLVANKLFATLDTTTRQLYLGDHRLQVTLSDTVGFIHHLPTRLVNAFRATLEEAIHADLLLHVVDMNHPMRDRHIQSVEEILEDIGAQTIPRILVLNKADQHPLLAGASVPHVRLDEYGKINEVAVSALTGFGLEELRRAVVASLQVTAHQDPNDDPDDPKAMPLEGLS